jgi:hypothetical protein
VTLPSSIRFYCIKAKFVWRKVAHLCTDTFQMAVVFIFCYQLAYALSLEQFLTGVMLTWFGMCDVFYFGRYVPPVSS